MTKTILPKVFKQLSEWTGLIIKISTVVGIVLSIFWTGNKIYDTYRAVAEIQATQIIMGQKIDKLQGDVKDLTRVLSEPVPLPNPYNIAVK